MTGPLRMQEEVDSHRGSQNTQHRIDEVVYTVRPGDTLSGIALAFYGDAEQEDRIFEANLGRLQSDGRQLNRHGLILPGWTLTVPGGDARRRRTGGWHALVRGEAR